MGLNELRDEALRIATEHGFNDATVLEEIALIHSELSEVVEDYRAGHTLTEVYFEKGTKPCGVGIEIADVIIRCLHFCGKHGIDVEEMVHQKMRYNETRPYKHGKKI